MASAQKTEHMVNDRVGLFLLYPVPRIRHQHRRLHLRAGARHHRIERTWPLIDSAKRLSDKILELKDFEDEIANAEESLKKLKEKARTISSIEIPAMMDEMQITKLKLKDGEAVEIKKVYGASIPKDQQEAAFTWLRNNGLGDIIKNDITVTFGRGEDNKAAS